MEATAGKGKDPRSRGRKEQGVLKSFVFKFRAWRDFLRELRLLSAFSLKSASRFLPAAAGAAGAADALSFLIEGTCKLFLLEGGPT